MHEQGHDTSVWPGRKSMTTSPILWNFNSCPGTPSYPIPLLQNVVFIYLWFSSKVPWEACQMSCHLPDLISFLQLLGSSKRRNQKLFCFIGLSQHESWHSLTQISSKRNNNNIKFPPTTMALVLFGWVVIPPVSCHQRTTNLQVYTVNLGMFGGFFCLDSTFL